MTIKTYRDNGAIGALLDEYEKAILELQAVINPITPAQLIAIADPQTKDSDCRSIQTILTHVVRAGYGYAIAIRNHQGEKLPLRERRTLDSISDYQSALNSMFDYNVELFKAYPAIQLETHNPSEKMLVSWGQLYDAEQIMEHAIVHILRHRRQIERFLLKLDV